MEYGDIIKPLSAIITKLKEIERHTGCMACGGSMGTTTSGVSTDIPAGLKSFSVVKTDSGGPTNLTLSDGSVYPLTLQGEVFSESATAGGKLPDYAISGGTWKWHGVI